MLKTNKCIPFKQTAIYIIRIIECKNNGRKVTRLLWETTYLIPE